MFCIVEHSGHVGENVLPKVYGSLTSALLAMGRMYDTIELDALNVRVARVLTLSADNKPELLTYDY